MKLDNLADALQVIARRESGPRFLAIPDRWYEDFHFRCTNDHVSVRVLKSEDLGRDACLAAGCRAPVKITFPEDVDGPLVSPAGADQYPGPHG